MARATIAILAALAPSLAAGCPAVAASVATGCRGAASDEARSDTDAKQPIRRLSLSRITFDPRGQSPPIRIPVPERTRSIAVVVQGDRKALYALSRLETSDRIDHVALPPAVDLPALLRAGYVSDRSGEMPGHLHQSIRLGLFTAIYPDRPAAKLPPGELTIQIATNDRSRPVAVDILLPEEDGAAALPIHLFRVSAEDTETQAIDEPFLARLRAILAAGGIDLRVERTIHLTRPDLAAMTELSEPQEPPDSASAQLALLGATMVEGNANALNVFIVDTLPRGIGGWSLGTPGPPLPDTYYSGIVAARLDGADRLARVLAHEIGHYLGLWHIHHTDRAGRLRTDALDDTEPGQANLMDEEGTGTNLTRDQRFVLTRHPFLVR